jgi:dihydrofolate reductase
MTLVSANMSMSLDGFIAGPNDGPEWPLGIGGTRLHEWLYDLESWRAPHGIEGGESTRDAEILEEEISSAGAIVMGKRMFDIGEPFWGANPPFHAPVFVLTSKEQPMITREGGTSYTFVTDGAESAVARAKAAADGKNVSIAGGANAVQQVLRSGLLDEIQVQVVPVLLGGGIRLFSDDGGPQVELARTRVVESPDVVHLKFRVLN